MPYQPDTYPRTKYAEGEMQQALKEYRDGAPNKALLHALFAIAWALTDVAAATRGREC